VVEVELFRLGVPEVHYFGETLEKRITICTKDKKTSKRL
jgi:hypothetical protein